MSADAVPIALVALAVGAFFIGLVVAVLRGQSGGRGSVTWSSFGRAVVTVLAAFAVTVVVLAVVGSGPRFGSLLVAWIGATLACVGSALSVWSYAQLGVNFSAEPEVKNEHELQTGGPYRLARHPAYAGILLLVLGGALASDHVLTLSAFVFILVLALRQTKVEEAALTERYASRYEEYAETAYPFGPPRKRN